MTMDNILTNIEEARAQRAQKLAGDDKAKENNGSRKNGNK